MKTTKLIAPIGSVAIMISLIIWIGVSMYTSKQYQMAILGYAPYGHPE